MAFTPEQEKKIYLARLYIADTETSPFYQIFTDEEIGSILEYRDWNLQKAIRDLAIAASMQFAQMTYRERTGDIEVWNNVSLQYQKALQDLINDNNILSLGNGIKPYFGGISWCEAQKINGNPDQLRSGLTWESHTIPTVGGTSTPGQMWLDQNYKSLFPGWNNPSTSAVIFIP